MSPFAGRTDGWSGTRRERSAVPHPPPLFHCAECVGLFQIKEDYAVGTKRPTHPHFRSATDRQAPHPNKTAASAEIGKSFPPPKEQTKLYQTPHRPPEPGQPQYPVGPFARSFRHSRKAAARHAASTCSEAMGHHSELSPAN